MVETMFVDGNRSAARMWTTGLVPGSNPCAQRPGRCPGATATRGGRTLTGKHPAVVRISGLGKTRRIRTEQRLAVLYAVSSILLEATDLKEAAARMLQALGDGLAWEYGALWLLDDKTESLYSHTTWHTSSIHASDFEFTTRQARFLPDSLSLPGRGRHRRSRSR